LSPSATLDLGDTIKTAPAIDINGYLYVSTTHGQLIKFLFRTSTMTGNIIWKANTYSSFNTSPVIGYDGTIYLGSTDAKLHAFDQSDGFEKWSLSLDNAISSTISINENGALYVGTTNGNLYCISENGTILWQYNSKFAIANATAYIDGCILFSNQNGELFKINDTDVFKSAVPGFDKVIAINKAPQWGTYQGNTRRSGVQAESTDLTAISELKMNQSIKVSPLPFHTTFKLSIDLKQESKALIQIIDLFGHVIYSNDFGNHSTGLYQETINGSNWVSGMYIYKVIVNNDVYTGKIIKE
jgi:outer membrane protein assembly factor BamB